jgi:predicted DNA-binding transcriptional regulator AlpA
MSIATRTERTARKRRRRPVKDPVAQAERAAKRAAKAARELAEKQAQLTFDFPTSTGRPPANKRFIGRVEVSERVGVAYSTIFRWMQLNKFPRAVAANGRTCWLESTIDEWMASRPPSRTYKNAR